MNAHGSPLKRLEAAHERVTGHSTRHGRITCAVCGTPSYKVAIKEAPNGSVLMHAFCGHSPAEVLGAVGLSLGDLFPERIRDMTPEGRREARQAFKETAWGAALSVLALEADVVFIASGMLRNAEVLTDADHERLGAACERIQSAKEVLQ